MFELTIKDTVYEFNFGMGFLREINKKVSTPVDGLPGVKKDIGLQYMIASVIDGDIDSLVEILDVANKGREPRVTRSLLDTYIEDENTDVDELFGKVIDFLKQSNATRKVAMNLLQAIENQQK